MNNKSFNNIKNFTSFFNKYKINEKKNSIFEENFIANFNVLNKQEKAIK